MGAWYLLGKKIPIVPISRPEVELRGGGFLDNLDNKYPVVQASLLEDGMTTRHSDLGFRIAALLPVSSTSKPVVALLETQPRLSHFVEENLYHMDRYYDKFAAHIDYYDDFDYE